MRGHYLCQYRRRDKIDQAKKETMNIRKSVLAIFFIFVLGLCDQLATSANGIGLILKDDGKWKIVNEDTLEFEIKLVPPITTADSQTVILKKQGWVYANLEDSLLLNDTAKVILIDEPPRCIRQPRPNYPDKARKCGIGGKTVVKALIDVDGSVIETVIAETSGSKSLDDAALAAMKKAKYKPAMRKDNPVQVWIGVPINFVLD
jgi:TonB family protein